MSHILASPNHSMEALNMEKMKKGGKPWKDEVLYASRWVSDKKALKSPGHGKSQSHRGSQGMGFKMGCHLGQWSKSGPKWLVRSRFCEVDPWCIYQSPMFFFFNGWIFDRFKYYNAPHRSLFRIHGPFQHTSWPPMASYGTDGEDLALEPETWNHVGKVRDQHWSLNSLDRPQWHPLIKGVQVLQHIDVQ